MSLSIVLFLVGVFVILMTWITARLRKAHGLNAKHSEGQLVPLLQRRVEMPFQLVVVVVLLAMIVFALISKVVD